MPTSKGNKIQASAALRTARKRGKRALASLLRFLCVSQLLACQAIPESREAVSAVELSGVPSRHEDEIRLGLSTRETPQLLGLFDGVYEYELFDPETLTRDLERIERGLRRRGYYEAKVRAARVLRLEGSRVRVELEVSAGERVRIGKLSTTGLAALPFDAAEHATLAISIEQGEPFDEDEYEGAKLAVANALADLGYAFVRVSGQATVDLADHRADIALTVNPGARSRYGKVAIEGLTEVPEGPVREALMLSEGAQYSRKELEQARAALLQLGAFSEVDIVPVLDRPESGVVPVVVRVKEAPLRSVTAGFGGELDVLRLRVKGRLGWTHQNFMGGLRKFSIATRPGVTFFPLRIDFFEQGITRLLPENTLTLRLEQPSFLEGRTHGFVESGYNVYPLLYPLPDDAAADEERIIGYNELTESLGVERSFIGRMVPVRLSFNFRANFPFSYQQSQVAGLSDVVVTYPELFAGLDLRDNPIQPTRGIYLSSAVQVAVPFADTQPADVRIRPEVRTFVPLDDRRRLILATRFLVGFVFPQNYGDSLLGGTFDDVQDQHKLLFRAFYSGGPDSNRGYPYQRIGPQGPLSFLVPSRFCDQNSGDSRCQRPLGGFSVWEASLELRYRIGGPWGLVAFVDASDVNTQVGSLSFDAPHLSVGPGLRYNSPVGPLRLDLGYRVPGLQELRSDPNETAVDVSRIDPYVDELPWQAFALHVLIGEAF